MSDDVVKAVTESLDYTGERARQADARVAQLQDELVRLRADLGEKSEALRDHVTAVITLRAEVGWFRDVIAEQFGYDAPGGDACNPLRKRLAALNAAAVDLLRAKFRLGMLHLLWDDFRPRLDAWTSEVLNGLFGVYADFRKQMSGFLSADALAPIPMVLHCPRCRAQHIDAPDPTRGWTNPPHRSHLCAACCWVWRPSDMPTIGVVAIKTQGTHDGGYLGQS